MFSGVAFITEAGSAFGQSAAYSLAQHGIRQFALVDTNEAGLQQTAQTLASQHNVTDVLAVSTECSTEDTVEAAAQQAASRFGRIDFAILNALVVNGVEYELDVLILTTGFLLATGENAAPAELFGIPVVGRNGRRLKDKYGAADFGTIHGIATNGFPNLFYPGLGGGPGSPNLTAVFDLEATHLANVLKEAACRVSYPTQLVIEPTKQAEDAWTDEVEKRALWYSVVLACTPGYFNHEGATLRHASSSPEKRRQMMRRVLHGGGTTMYERIVREYDAKGDIEGFEVS